MAAIEFASGNGARSNNAANAITQVDGLDVWARNSSGASWGTFLLKADAAKTSGKWVHEVTYSRGAVFNCGFGLGLLADMPTAGTPQWLQADKKNLAIYIGDADLHYNNASVVTDAVSGFAAAYTPYVLTFYIDMDTRKLWVAQDGVISSGGDPAAGTTPTYTVPGTHALEPMHSMNRNSDGALFLHQPDGIIYPADGFTPFGHVLATLSLTTGSIESGGAQITGSYYVRLVSRDSAVEYYAGLATITDGALSLSFAADITDGTTALLYVNSTSGELITGGRLVTVGVA